MTITLSSQTSVPDVPVTVERKPYYQGQHSLGRALPDVGTARANVAATPQHPEGTNEGNWAANHTHQTVLQQHCDFFDRDHDGVIWPLDTFLGFHDLGFNILFCALAAFVINVNLSYPTAPTWFPDPFFRIYIARIHKDKHGSDSGTYDCEGRFVPQHFEDTFAKYAPEGQDGLTLEDIWRMLRGQRLTADPFGWFGAFFEWMALYIMLWPEDGLVKKEDIRRLYDGSLFYEVAERRRQKNDKMKKAL